MRNALNTRLPFYRSVSDSRYHWIANRTGNAGYSEGVLQPNILAPEILIERTEGSYQEVDTVKLVKVSDGSEIDLTVTSGQINYWQQNGKPYFSRSQTSEVGLIGIGCELYYYKVQFIDEIWYYYSDFIKFSDKVSPLDSQLLPGVVRISGNSECAFANISFTNFTPYFYGFAEETETKYFNEQVIEQDANFEESTVSHALKKTHKIFFPRITQSEIDQLHLFSLLVQKGNVVYRNGTYGEYVDTEQKLSKIEIEETQYPDPWYPNITIYVTYEEVQTGDDCCTILEDCSDLVVNLITAPVIAGSTITITYPIADVPDGYWLIIERRPFGSPTWVNPEFLNTVSGSNYTITLGLTPGDWEFRITLKNWNCSVEGGREGPYTIS